MLSYGQCAIAAPASGYDGFLQHIFIEMDINQVQCPYFTSVVYY